MNEEAIDIMSWQERAEQKHKNTLNSKVQLPRLATFVLDLADARPFLRITGEPACQCQAGQVEHELTQRGRVPSSTATAMALFCPVSWRLQSPNFIRLMID